jgi:hypothetical protein
MARRTSVIAKKVESAVFARAVRSRLEVFKVLQADSCGMLPGGKIDETHAPT